MEDDKGRSWICHPIKRDDVEALDLFKDFPAIIEADEKIRAKTEVRKLFCEVLRELTTNLADPQGSSYVSDHKKIVIHDHLSQLQD